ESGIQINPIHVSDAAAAIVKALKVDGFNQINIAGNEVISLKQIGLLAGKLLHKTPVFDSIPNIQPIHLVADNSKMKQLLTFPKMSFSQGIQEIL
ncbi:MAG TPA: hypothetical protein DCM08_10980, partial [Microscillaceae bacterium]|nr:hypothetical protein [Microscillaceae bacterium]